MKLIEGNEFVRNYFVPGSAPDMRTLRSDVQRKLLPGKAIGKRIYIDLDAFTGMIEGVYSVETSSDTSTGSKRRI